MRKHYILFFSALVFLTACKSKNEPKGLIEEDVLIRLLADVHIIDGSLMSEIGPDSLFKHGTGKYMYLFKQYHTDSGTFKRTMRYYSRDNERMIRVYGAVGDIIQKRTDSVNDLQNAVAKKELERLQKQNKDVEKGRQDQAQREHDRLELIRQEGERRQQQEQLAKDRADAERRAVLEKAKQEAKRQRDSINRLIKVRSTKKN